MKNISKNLVCFIFGGIFASWLLIFLPILERERCKISPDKLVSLIDEVEQLESSILELEIVFEEPIFPLADMNPVKRQLSRIALFNEFQQEIEVLEKEINQICNCQIRSSSPNLDRISNSLNELRASLTQTLLSDFEKYLEENNNIE